MTDEAKATKPQIESYKGAQIEPYKGGWMVRLPDGDYAWQPSKQFAEAYVRHWIAKDWKGGLGSSQRSKSND